MRDNEPDVTLAEGKWVVLAFHVFFASFSLGLGAILVTHPVEGLGNRMYAEDIAPLWVWGVCHLVVGANILIGTLLRSYDWIVRAFLLGAAWYTFWAALNLAPAAESPGEVPLAVGWQLLFIAVVHVLRMLSEIRRRASATIRTRGETSEQLPTDYRLERGSPSR